jgi:ribosome-associated protein
VILYEPMHDDEPAERPSKSERKRESQALQDLGETLIGLPDALLADLPLPENLREAVLAARRMSSHGAQLRQRQYIGKLMRKLDAQPIREALQQYEDRQRAQARRFQRVEQWRDRLVREGEPALSELLALVSDKPETDSGDLTRLVTEARNEAASGRAPRAARILFQRLRALLG